MRYIGPKDRLSRREGYDLFGKGAKLTRLGIPPGFHGRRGTGKVSDFGRQLREKQKVKRIYGVSERQFKKYVTQAQKSKGNTGNALIQLLERRLDNVVYRLGFTSTRPGARQLVSHKHILVDGEKLNISSYLVNVGETVSLDKKALNRPEVKKSLDNKEYKPSLWLERQAITGRIKNLPAREDVMEPISEQDIIEYYSR